MEVSIVIPCFGFSDNIKKNYQNWLSVSSDICLVDSHPGCHILAKFCERNQLQYYVFDWQGGYPKKRQWFISRGEIKNDWVLMLDDDEVVPKAFAMHLKNLKVNANIGAFQIRYDNWFLGKKLKYGVPMTKVALVNRNYGCFQEINDNKWSKFDMEVHEHFITSKKIKLFSKRLEHRQLSSFRDLTLKHVEYAKWEISRIEDNVYLHGASVRQRVKNLILKSSLAPLVYFVYHFFFKLGFLDGRVGLLYSIMKCNYFAMIASDINENR